MTTIVECGNGFPAVGDWIADDNGDVYEVLSVGSIQTSQFQPWWISVEAIYRCHISSLDDEQADALSDCIVRHTGEPE